MQKIPDKAGQRPENGPRRTKKKPERSNSAVYRMVGRKCFSFSHDAGQLSTDLIRAQRAFDFRLVVTG